MARVSLRADCRTDNSSSWKLLDSETGVSRALRKHGRFLGHRTMDDLVCSLEIEAFLSREAFLATKRFRSITDPIEFRRPPQVQCLLCKKVRSIPPNDFKRLASEAEFFECFMGCWNLSASCDDPQETKMIGPDSWKRQFEPDGFNWVTWLSGAPYYITPTGDKLCSVDDVRIYLRSQNRKLAELHPNIRQLTPQNFCFDKPVFQCFHMLDSDLQNVFVRNFETGGQEEETCTNVQRMEDESAAQPMKMFTKTAPESDVGRSPSNEPPMDHRFCSQAQQEISRHADPSQDIPELLLSHKTAVLCEVYEIEQQNGCIASCQGKGATPQEHVIRTGAEAVWHCGGDGRQSATAATDAVIVKTEDERRHGLGKTVADSNPAASSANGMSQVIAAGRAPPVVSTTGENRDCIPDGIAVSVMSQQHQRKGLPALGKERTTQMDVGGLMRVKTSFTPETQSVRHAEVDCSSETMGRGSKIEALNASGPRITAKVPLRVPSIHDLQEEPVAQICAVSSVEALDASGPRVTAKVPLRVPSNHDFQEEPVAQICAVSSLDAPNASGPRVTAKVQLRVPSIRDLQEEPTEQICLQSQVGSDPPERRSQFQTSAKANILADGGAMETANAAGTEKMGACEKLLPDRKQRVSQGLELESGVSRPQREGETHTKKLTRQEAVFEAPQSQLTREEVNMVKGTSSACVQEVQQRLVIKKPQMAADSGKSELKERGSGSNGGFLGGVQGISCEGENTEGIAHGGRSQQGKSTGSQDWVGWGDSACYICDDGGKIICCDGRCGRSFHIFTEEETDCPGLQGSMGMSAKEAEGYARKEASFVCPNCKLEKHVCFICHKLGSSSRENLELVRCAVDGCGHFYHPACIDSWESQVRGELSTGSNRRPLESKRKFICPLHQCFSCKKRVTVEAAGNRICCRRCPKVFHTSCVPSELISPEDGLQRVWGLLGDGSPPMLYCLDHKLVINAPERSHHKFPDSPERDAGYVSFSRRQVVSTPSCTDNSGADGKGKVGDANGSKRLKRRPKKMVMDDDDDDEDGETSGNEVVPTSALETNPATELLTCRVGPSSEATPVMLKPLPPPVATATQDAIRPAGGGAPGDELSRVEAILSLRNVREQFLAAPFGRDAVSSLHSQLEGLSLEEIERCCSNARRALQLRHPGDPKQLLPEAIRLCGPEQVALVSVLHERLKKYLKPYLGWLECEDSLRPGGHPCGTPALINDGQGMYQLSAPKSAASGENKGENIPREEVELDEQVTEGLRQPGVKPCPDGAERILSPDTVPQVSVGVTSPGRNSLSSRHAKFNGPGHLNTTLESRSTDGMQTNKDAGILEHQQHQMTEQAARSSQRKRTADETFEVKGKRRKQCVAGEGSSRMLNHPRRSEVVDRGGSKEKYPEVEHVTRGENHQPDGPTSTRHYFPGTEAGNSPGDSDKSGTANMSEARETVAQDVGTRFGSSSFGKSAGSKIRSNQARDQMKAEQHGSCSDFVPSGKPGVSTMGQLAELSGPRFLATSQGLPNPHVRPRMHTDAMCATNSRAQMPRSVLPQGPPTAPSRSAWQSGLARHSSHRRGVADPSEMQSQASWRTEHGFNLPPPGMAGHTRRHEGPSPSAPTVFRGFVGLHPNSVRIAPSQHARVSTPTFQNPPPHRSHPRGPNLDFRSGPSRANGRK